MLPYAKEADKNFQYDEEEPYDYKKAKEVRWYHHVLLNRPLKVILSLLLLAVVLPILMYNYMFVRSFNFPPSDGYSMGSCLLPRNARLPCGLGTFNDTNTECHPQCCHDFQNNFCFHRFPSRFSYISEAAWTEDTVLRPRVSNVPFKNQTSIETLKVLFNEMSSTHVSFEIYNAELKTLKGRRIEQKDYVYHVESPEFDIMINRTDATKLFSTVRGPIIASDNIWEIAFKITDETMFGLGEIPLKENTTKAIYNNKEGLSSIPLIYARANNSYHGVLIDIKEPTEISVRGANQIVIRSITKIGLKFHVFVGPRPSDIMRDVTQLIGSNKNLEYWMLGAHVCSETTETPNDALTELTDFIRETRTQNIPFDSHCGADSWLFEDDFCEKSDNVIQRGAVQVRNAGKKFVPHIYPYVLYEKVEEEITTLDPEQITTLDPEKITTLDPELNPDMTTPKEICKISEKYQKSLLTTEENEIYIGEIGKKTVIYPDYNNIDDEFFNKVLEADVEFDGAILVDNWPLDQSEKNYDDAYERLPYFSENFENAFNDTPLWNVNNSHGDAYMYTHTVYGNEFAKYFLKTHEELPFFSTSQWMNGAIVVNKQNIDALWANLHKELIEAALGGISGHRLWSSPVCGDTEYYNTTTQQNLCVKWYMAATYMPLIKIHSKMVRRDPMSFTGNNRGIIKRALERRSSLLPYFYTTMLNGPLLRPMFYQFPDSEKLQSVNGQFSVGEALLIVPNLMPDQSRVPFTMPPGAWFEFWSGLPINGEEGQTVSMTTTHSDFLVFIRGGSIIILQKDVRLTAVETRLRSSFTFVVALKCENINKSPERVQTEDTAKSSNETVTICSANGNLYVTESLTLTFEANSTSLTIKPEGEDFSALCNQETKIWANILQDITIYGLQKEFNNNDNHRSIQVSKNLCDLETNEEIIISLIDTS